jgi:23S rRNA (pseudouridine1915-N3)-methyltransferase
MKFKVCTVGQPSDPNYRALSEMYQSRIRRYVDLEMVAVRPERQESRSSAEIKLLETERLMEKCAAADFCVVLDRRGRNCSSEELAKKINGWMQSGKKQIVFMIGGPVGMDDSVLQRADETLSLSSLTLAHELALVVFLEQLYRGLSILRGEKYHK